MPISVDLCEWTIFKAFFHRTSCAGARFITSHPEHSTASMISASLFAFLTVVRLRFDVMWISLRYRRFSIRYSTLTVYQKPSKNWYWIWIELNWIEWKNNFIYLKLIWFHLSVFLNTKKWIEPKWIAGQMDCKIIGFKNDFTHWMWEGNDVYNRRLWDLSLALNANPIKWTVGY